MKRYEKEKEKERHEKCHKSGFDLSIFYLFYFCYIQAALDGLD
jgi:hypothetical protein